MPEASTAGSQGCTPSTKCLRGREPRGREHTVAEAQHTGTAPRRTSVRLSIGARPEFSARLSGTMSRASAKARIAYCSTPGTWSAAASTAREQAICRAGRRREGGARGGVSHLVPLVRAAHAAASEGEHAGSEQAADQCSSRGPPQSTADALPQPRPHPCQALASHSSPSSPARSTHLCSTAAVHHMVVADQVTGHAQSVVQRALCLLNHLEGGKSTCGRVGTWEAR